MVSTKSTIASFVSALCISLAPVPAQSLNSEIINSIQPNDTISYRASSGYVYLPIDEATDFLKLEAKNLRSLLNQLIAVRDKNGIIPLFDNSSRVRLIKAVRENAQFVFELKSALRIALSNLGKPEADEQLKLRKKLIDFGKALAGVEFILKDVLSAHAQSKPPEKTLKTTGLISEAGAKALIESEHKSLGLAPPVFGS